MVQTKLQKFSTLLNEVFYSPTFHQIYLGAVGAQPVQATSVTIQELVTDWAQTQTTQWDIPIIFEITFLRKSGSLRIILWNFPQFLCSF